MSEIVLREPELIATVTQIVESEGRTAAEFLNDAVRKAITTYRQKRIQAESEAWYALSAEQRDAYAGQFVAVHNGQVVDSDGDRMVLFGRVRETFGREPVALLEGGREPMPTYRVTSVRAG